MPSKESIVFPMPGHSISSHLIDDELILFDARSKQLARLNETASQIWKMHEMNASVDEIVYELSELYGLQKEKVFPDVNKALNQWQAIGMLGDNYTPTIDEEDDALSYMKKATEKYVDSQDLMRVKAFKFLDTRFVVDVSNNALKNILLPLISHLKTTEKEASHKIKVIEKNSNYIILENEMELGHTRKINEVAPIVNAHIQITSFLEVDCLSVFHSGVVHNKGGVVLLSAGSGSGKSTLTAALMCSGKKYFTDELAILTHDKKIRPAPGCVVLKEGSWNVIKEFYPKIIELMTHKRLDKKIVKYIPPISLPTKEQLKQGEEVKAIVFPNYLPENSTELIKISSADALVKITDAGYHTNQSLNHESVAKLVEWIKDIPAYELKVNDLKKAVNLISELF